MRLSQNRLPLPQLAASLDPAAPHSLATRTAKTIRSCRGPLPHHHLAASPNPPALTEMERKKTSSRSAPTRTSPHLRRAASPQAHPGTAARAARRRPRRRRARRRSCPRRCTWPTSRATSTRITCARFSVTTARSSWRSWPSTARLACPKDSDMFTLRTAPKRRRPRPTWTVDNWMATSSPVPSFCCPSARPRPLLGGRRIFRGLRQSQAATWGGGEPPATASVTGVARRTQGALLRGAGRL